jgi:phosphohistidine phosphatase
MTLDGIAGAFPEGTEARIEDELYAASARRLLARVQEVDDSVTGLMLIGHNPGMEDLATTLVGDGDEELRDRLATKFPTGALATLSFDGSWRGLDPGSATLDALVTPRELS